MSGGEINPANTIAYTCGNIVPYAGLLVMRGATAGYCLVTTASSDEPIGYTYTNTKHPITAANQSGQRVGIHALIEGQLAEFKLPATHAAITLGCEMMSSTVGTVIKKTAGVGWVVGTAEEAISQDTGGYVTVRISKRYTYAS